ncbi:Zn-dependent peptidase ImmA (M78 family) [Paenibacillus sp. DS2015]|uniref:hypothetical protein n=1 Tax=Paenibacillus sp. DS2015 TaxID=3373917 RepID=UPI003D249882
MKIPQKVKVGAMTYDVKITEHPITVSGRECVGSITYDKQLIEIRDETYHSTQSMVNTFWHELFHAFTHERGIEWGDNDELYTEELAKAMHAFCVDNGLDFIEGGGAA